MTRHAFRCYVKSMNIEKRTIERTVVQSNLLIESRYKFTLSELKLFLLMVAQVKQTDKDFKKYRIYISEFVELQKGKKTRLYLEAKQTCISLREKSIVLKTEEGGWYVTGFINSAAWRPGESYVEFTFDAALKEHLLELKKRFTAYDIGNIINCRSTYSIRIYQLLKAFQKLGTRTMELAELRPMLGIEERQFRGFNDFKRYVLEVAKRELKRESDIYFDYKTKKKGRKVHSIIFEILKQKQRKLDFSDKDYLEIETAKEAREEADKRKEKAFELYRELDENTKEKLVESFEDEIRENKFLWEKYQGKGFEDKTIEMQFSSFLIQKLLNV